MMPGTMNPFIARGEGLAAYIFDAVDERMTRSIVAGPSTRRQFTISFWLKVSETPAESLYFMRSGPSGNYVSLRASTTGELGYVYVYMLPLIGRESAAGVVPFDGSWHHYVYAVDTTAASAGDRIRLYKDGAQLVTSTISNDYDQNEDAEFLKAGHTLLLGNGSSTFAAKRMAFIDVVEGAAMAPTDFAFDNGGVWTRKRYAGSYGTYGFAFDGSDLFNDVSGNDLHMTPENMDAGNLDPYDLPPHTN